MYLFEVQCVGHSTVILLAFDPHDWFTINRLANIYLFNFLGSFDLDWMVFPRFWT